MKEELGVEPLLLHIERSQLRWLGHLYQMPPGRLPREVFLVCPTVRGDPEEENGWMDGTNKMRLCIYVCVYMCVYIYILVAAGD